MAVPNHLTLILHSKNSPPRNLATAFSPLAAVAAVRELAAAHLGSAPADVILSGSEGAADIPDGGTLVYLREVHAAAQPADWQLEATVVSLGGRAPFTIRVPGRGTYRDARAAIASALGTRADAFHIYMGGSAPDDLPLSGLGGYAQSLAPGGQLQLVMRAGAAAEGGAPGIA